MSSERKIVESFMAPLYKLGMHPNQGFLALVTKVIFLVNISVRCLFIYLASYMVGINLHDVDSIIDGLEAIVVLLEVPLNLIPLLVYKHQLKQLIIDMGKFWQRENQDWSRAVKCLNFYKNAFWFTYVMVSLSCIIGQRPILKFYVPNFDHAKLFLYTLMEANAYFDNVIIIAMDCYLYASCYFVERQFYLMQEKLDEINLLRGTTAIKSELSKWTLHHDFLLSYTLSLAKMFEVKFFLKYILYIGMFCAETYVLSNTRNIRKSFEAITKAVHGGLQFTLVCVLTARVSDAAESVYQAVYSLKWYNWPVHLRKDLTVIIQRAQNVPRFTAMGIIPIDHSTLTSVFQKAYSYYTIAKNFVVVDREE